jgi:hypothetical protein
MGAFARLGLLATASVLFSGVAQAAVSVSSATRRLGVKTALAFV